jgi:chemotaxis protein CheX
MRMELIQPFLNSADAVLSEMLGSPTQIEDVAMDEQVYRRAGLAALISIEGELQGRVILDVDESTAGKLTAKLAGVAAPSEPDVRDAVCEVANMIIGNAVTLLNNDGFRFRVRPPTIHSAAEGLAGARDTEALVLCFQTACGPIRMNIAMRYAANQQPEPATSTRR